MLLRIQEGHPWSEFCNIISMPPKPITKTKTVHTISTPTVTIADTPLQDPFGNTVIIAGTLHNLDGGPVAAEGIFAAIQFAIRQPVLVLEMEQGEVDYYFYYKTDEQNSLLIGTKKTNGHFTATICQKNPAPAQMSLLYKKATRIR
jgi:hypothetical protein